MSNDEVEKLADPSVRPFDLEERSAIFGERIIAFVASLKHGPVINPLISQLVRAATSVGANYAEAHDAESPKDFRHKIGLCRKESRETKHWLRMLAAATDSDKREPIRVLWQEAKELNLIFGAILRKLKEKK